MGLRLRAATDSGFFHFAGFLQRKRDLTATSIAKILQDVLESGGGDRVGRAVRTVISVDDTTGEVKNMSTVYVSTPQSEPAYLKLYMDGLARLREIPLYCWPVLLWLLGRMPYANADQCFEFGVPMRQRACGELKVKISQVNHAVADLVKCGAVLRVDRGLYRFNPAFFARGEWKDIQKLRSCAE